MENEETDEYLLLAGHRFRLEVDVVIKNTQKFWSFKQFLPNFAVSIRNFNQVADFLRSFINPKGMYSEEHTGNDTDALNDIEPVLSNQLKYPHAAHYTAPSKVM